MKKIISLLLVIVLCMSALAACVQEQVDEGPESNESSKSETEESTPETEESTPETEESTPETESIPETEESTPETEESDIGGDVEDEPITNDILVSALSEYYLIRADITDTIDCAVKLNETLSDKLSVNTKGIKTDFVIEGSDDYAVREFEIIIGETNREESINFAATLKNGEYGYTVVGKKIVILGKPASNNALAVDKFITDIIDAHRSDSDIFVFENTQFVNKLVFPFDGITINGTDISEFDIVYKNTHGANEEKLANDIKNTVAKLAGIELNTVAYRSTNVKPKQIVVYDSKSLSNAMKEEKETLLASAEDMNKNGIVIVDENTVWLYGYTIVGVKAAVDNFIEMINDSTKGNVTVTAGVYDEVVESIKVMSFNVYVGTKGANSEGIMTGGPAQRQQYVITTIRNQMPDVLGVQEASNIWISFLSKGLKANGYKYVGTGREPHLTGQSANEGCQIFYNADKYDVIETNTYWLSDTPDVFSKYSESEYTRIVTYAIFERKSDGFRFMHVNTHLDFAKAQNKQIAKMFDLINAVDFDGLTVFTGDFNMTSSSTGYDMMYEEGCYNSYDLAQISTEGSASGFIDFCFVRPDNEIVSEHAFVKETFGGLFPSDHRAVYAVILPSILKFDQK